MEAIIEYSWQTGEVPYNISSGAKLSLPLQNITNVKTGTNYTVSVTITSTPWDYEDDEVYECSLDFQFKD